MPDNNLPCNEVNLGAIGNLYRGLIASWIHQDRLMQNRANMLIAVQGAIIGSSIYTNTYVGKWYAFILLVLGAMFTLAILRLRDLDERDRDLALPIIVWAGKQLLGLKEEHLHEKGILEKNKSLDQVLSLYQYYTPLEGGQIIRWFIGLFVIIDGMLAIGAVMGWLPTITSSMVK